MNGLRILVWPGVRLTFGGRPNPESVRIDFGPLYDPAPRTIRLVSKRGWMLLLVGYDWRYPDRPAAVLSHQEQQ